MLKLNVSKFKKVGGDKDFTIMRHKDGHEIRIAHKPLSAEMRGELDSLPASEPEKMAKGGRIHTQSIPNYSKNIPHLADGGKIKPANAYVDQSGNLQPLDGKYMQNLKNFQAGYTNTPPEKLTSVTEVPYEMGDAETDAALGQEQTMINQQARQPSSMPVKSPVDMQVQPAQETFPAVVNQAHGGEIKDPTQQHLLPGDKMPNKIEKSVVKDAKKRMADGGDVSSSMQDSPEQIINELPQASSAPAQQQIDPQLQAKRDLYNQQVQTLSNSPGDPDEKTRIAAQQFGPNGEPPANFNVNAWNTASSNYDQSQLAETANKKAQADQIAKSNQARIASGLDPIPLTSDQQASMQPGGQPAPASAPITEQTPPDAAIPGDDALKATQGGKQAVSSSYGQTPAQQAEQQSGVAGPQKPSDMQVQQKLTAAKQLTYDALMHERQQMLSQINNVKPETMGSLFADRSLPGKLGMIAGLMLGGGSAGVLGGPNQVAKMYEDTIDRDLRAQQLNMANKQSLLSNNLAIMGNIPDAIKMSKINMMDKQMHDLVQLAQKYPNNPQIQQNLQAMGMMGMQSTSNLHDTLATNIAWRHAAEHISDPTQHIQFNPMLTPEQKSGALKELGTYQNMNAARNNILDAFDKVSNMKLAGTFSPNQRDSLLEPGLAQAIKDSEGRITPQDTHMIRALMPSPTDTAQTRGVKRVQLAKFMSSKMNFPMLQLAGVDVSQPTPGSISAGPPNRPNR